jgi:hypothetical protein
MNHVTSDHNPYTAAQGDADRHVTFTSEGQPTVRISPQQAADATYAQPDAASVTAAPAANNNKVGWVLVGLGVLVLLGQMVLSNGAFLGGMVLLTLASCFLFFAFWKHVYGLLIPGCIIAGLSVGVTFAGLTNGVSVLWGLALGFLAITLVGGSVFNVPANWPTYVAVPLFGVGCIVALANLPAMLVGIVVWLPVLLIGAGLYLGWKQREGNHANTA